MFSPPAGKVRARGIARLLEISVPWAAIKTLGKRQARGNLPRALDQATYLDGNLTRGRPPLRLQRHLLLPEPTPLTRPLQGQPCPLPGHHHQRQRNPAQAQQDREDLHHRRQQPHCGHLPHHQYVLATPAQLAPDLQDLQDPTQPLAPPLLPLQGRLQAAPPPQHLQGSPLKLQDLTR